MLSGSLASVGTESGFSFSSLRSSVSLRKAFSREGVCCNPCMGLTLAQGSEVFEGRIGELDQEEAVAIFRWRAIGRANDLTIRTSKLDLDNDGAISDGELLRGMKHTPQVALRFPAPPLPTHLTSSHRFLQSDNPILRALASRVRVIRGSVWM
eukprot:184473-Hanusia_phi.AAC.1